MEVSLALAAHDLMWDLKKANAVLTGLCYENCMIAVLGPARVWRLDYVLGLMTPPGHETVAHAWLAEHREDGPVYLDPTLQDASMLWSRRRSEFIYDERFRFSREELLEWLLDKHPGRSVGESGVPEGELRKPMIDADGRLI